MRVNEVNQYRQPVIVASAHGDVNGDRIMDYVFLTAVKSVDPSSLYLEQISLHIQDPRSRGKLCIPIDGIR